MRKSTSERKRKNNGGSQFVTHSECRDTTDIVKADLRILKVAMVGVDLRGGMLKDFTDLRSQVDKLLTSKEETKVLDKEKRESALRWKLLAVGFACTLAGFVGQYLLSRFGV